MFVVALLLNETAGRVKPIEEHFDQGYYADPFSNEVLEMIRNKSTSSKKISFTECKDNQGRVMFGELFYVPNHDTLQLEVMRLYQDVPAGGHPGGAKTFELLSKDYYWPKMRTYMK